MPSQLKHLDSRVVTRPKPSQGRHLGKALRCCHGGGTERHLVTDAWEARGDQDCQPIHKPIEWQPLRHGLVKQFSYCFIKPTHSSSPPNRANSGSSCLRTFSRCPARSCMARVMPWTTSGASAAPR